nr:copia protein [Tanacetum cinerariifolium]
MTKSYCPFQQPEKVEKDPKEDPADYPADIGNNDDDESSNDDDDDDDVEKDEEDMEEEKHLASTDPSDVSADDLECLVHFIPNKREAKGKSHVELSIGDRNLSEKFKDFSSNCTNRVNAASTPVIALEPNSTNSTNTFSAAGPSNNDVSSNFEIAPQTKSITRIVKEQGGVTQINDEDFHTCSKWVFRNKKDERGIVIRNKARLVARGHAQEEGIDYEEVFAPIVRIIAIRLFLAYASFMGFMVYQMDVKSAFLYGTSEEEVYVCQPPGLEDLDYHDKVYKVVKALCGLHQAPRGWYETLAHNLLENGF